MKSLMIIASLILFLSTTAQGGGIVDISNNPKGDLATVIIAEPAERLVLTAILAKGYREVFIGRRFTLNGWNISTLVGTENIIGVEEKLRGRVAMSGTVGPATVLLIQEFGGVSGKWQKMVIGYPITKELSTSFVRLNGRNGGRIDFEVGGVTPYIEFVGRERRIGLIVGF